MPMDPGAVGRTYVTALPYDVSRAKIREFAVAAGDTNPAYLDVDAARALGHADLLAPPTFPILVAFVLLEQLISDPELGLALHRIVHAEQRFAYTRPIHAGDALAAMLTLEGVRRAAGADLIATRTEVTTATGDPICTARASLVHRGEDG